MNDFEYDSYIKKRIARGSRNRKSGSKSGKCNLPSDRMTQKQWKERNGEVMSYNLNAPMSWEEFKSMPKDIQVEYVKKLRDTYGTTATDLARFFGCVPSTVTKYCKSSLDIIFDPGKRMTRKQKEAFYEFAGDVITVEDNEDANIEASNTPSEADKPFEFKKDFPVRAPHIAPAHRIQENFNMKEICMNFSGCFDPDALRNSLLMSIGAGTPVYIDIRCTIIN